MRKHWRAALWIMLLLLIAACTSDAPLPTLARLATDTPLPPDQPTREVAQAPRELTFPATFTPTISPTISTTPTVTPSATITETSTLTPSPLPTIRPEDRPLLGLAEAALRHTALPDDYVVPPYEGYNATLATPPAAVTDSSGAIVIGGSANSTSAPPAPATATPQSDLDCLYYPAGRFADIYRDNPRMAQQLGCLTAPPETRSVTAAYQSFQEGLMLWRSDRNSIYILSSSTGDFRQYPDTFQEGSDPEDSSETPPDGLLAPRRGFLKVWQNQPGVRDALGWALQPEQAVTLTVQSFPNGAMLSVPGMNQILVFIGDSAGQWRGFNGTF